MICDAIEISRRGVDVAEVVHLCLVYIRVKVSVEILFQIQRNSCPLHFDIKWL